MALVVTIDPEPALAKVKSALPRNVRPELVSVRDAVAENALLRRLLPVLEEDVKSELRERAEEEAMRFSAQHLRHILLAPVLGTAAGRRPARQRQGRLDDRRGGRCGQARVAGDPRSRPVRSSRRS